MSLASWVEAQREANRLLAQQRREAAAPGCSICNGRGETQGYIAPTKTATYACPCTGMADWQRES